MKTGRLRERVKKGEITEAQARDLVTKHNLETGTPVSEPFLRWLDRRERAKKGAK